MERPMPPISTSESDSSRPSRSANAESGTPPNPPPEPDIRSIGFESVPVLSSKQVSPDPPTVIDPRAFLSGKANLSDPTPRKPTGSKSAPSSPGAVVPGYEILATLGRGAMGVVYQARQSSLNRVVALKVMLAGGHATDEDRARFRTEALTVAQLQHPNVIQIHDVGEHDGVPFLAVEYVGGGNL